MRLKHYHRFAIAILFPLLIGSAVFAQTNEFTYQGSLKDGVNPANGNYDLEFQLYSVPSGGAPIGTRTRLAVPVTNGLFTVRLDFAPAAFDGENRFLEIGVRPAGSPGGYQQLLPRQLITSDPYSYRSLNATTAQTATNALQLGGVAANQYVLTGDPRMSDARNPLPGSNGYVQNRTTPQTLTNFNISGNGTVGLTLSASTVDAITQYNIGGNRVLSAGGSFNVFAGVDAGANNTGLENSFFGNKAGRDNASGSFNAFFGALTGLSNTSGGGNSFFGNNAGWRHTTGLGNSFFGRIAGQTNTTGDYNTAVGYNADVGSGGLTYATAIGAGTVVNASNTIKLGRDGGTDTVVIPGKVEIGTLATISGSLPLCLNDSNRVTICPPSSLRYKTNIETFSSSLEAIRRLRPITFNYKESGERDIGFAAEEVAEIEPLLATYNKTGQIEGVKYGQITTVLVNAVKEQQLQIQQQREQIRQQQIVVDGLKKLVCQTNAQAEVCK